MGLELHKEERKVVKIYFFLKSQPWPDKSRAHRVFEMLHASHSQDGVKRSFEGRSNEDLQKQHPNEYARFRRMLDTYGEDKAQEECRRDGYWFAKKPPRVLSKEQLEERVSRAEKHLARAKDALEKAKWELELEALKIKLKAVKPKAKSKSKAKAKAKKSVEKTEEKKDA